MNDKTIKPCPWCNPEFAGLPPRVNTANGTQHWVFCPECGMHGPCGIGEAEAIDRWNAVVSSPAAEQEPALETLPCDVHLPPNTLIHKGVKFSALLAALKSRVGGESVWTVGSGFTSETVTRSVVDSYASPPASPAPLCDAMEAAREINREIANNTANYDFLADEEIAAIIRKHCQHTGPQAGWVKCSERMPNLAEYVLIEHLFSDLPPRIEEANWQGSFGWYASRNHGQWVSPDSVKRWCPISAAPGQSPQAGYVLVPRCPFCNTEADGPTSLRLHLLSCEDFRAVREQNAV